MTNIGRHNDIDNDEIRVIRPIHRTDHSPSANSRKKKSTFRMRLFLAIGAAIAIAVFLLYDFYIAEKPLLLRDKSTLDIHEIPTIIADSIDEKTPNPGKKQQGKATGFVEISDTTVNNVSLAVFHPRNATPTLHIGTDILHDSDAVLAVQAADIRSDNGEIVGAYVLEGNLISKGKSKSGFCAIIGENITIGMADSTPYFEQAIESDGYFFRQYPLVIAGQVVENKPKGQAFRKALAEWNGATVVILSHTKLTFYDFAQSLANLGVTNAIYLVGSTSFGYAINLEGNRIEFGKEAINASADTNYIVWK